MNTAPIAPPPTPHAVFEEIAGMLRQILGEVGMGDAEITREARFHDDLELESIDLVALAGRLGERYGDRVNFAQFIADLTLDEIIALQVGRLVDYVVMALEAGAAAAPGPAAHASSASSRSG